MPERDHQSLVTVASYWDATEAWMAKNRLADEGIEAVIVDENLIGTYWLYANAVGGVKVQVMPDDGEKAAAVLDVIRPLTLPSPAHDNTAFVVEKCPQCGSKEMSRKTYWRRAIFASWLLLGFPIPIRRRCWVCLECGYREKTKPLQFSIKSLLIFTFLVALALGLMRATGQTWMANYSSDPVSDEKR